MLDNLLEFLAAIARALVWLLLGYLLALGTVYAICHIHDSWDEPMHDHSGFTPDYHTAHVD